MVRFLPNLLTLLNLMSGCAAVIAVLDGQDFIAVICVGLSLFFDFLDGLAARALQHFDPIGVQLDSLADVVSFGVVPGIMYYAMFVQVIDIPLLHYSGFLFTLFGAYRLARFNVQKSGGPDFNGLPIPAAAIFVAGLYLLDSDIDCAECNRIFINPYFISISLILLCMLMVSVVPHFSFKVKSYGWKGNEIRWIYLLLVAGGILVLGKITVMLSIVLYIFLSLVYFSSKP